MNILKDRAIWIAIVIIFMSAAAYMIIIDPDRVNKMDNIEEGAVKRLGELAEKSKAEVTIVSTESEEGVSLQKAFGGLAAILSYPIS